MGLSDKIRARLERLQDEESERPFLGRKIQERKTRRHDTFKSEMSRICRLPLMGDLDKTTYERLNYQWVEARAYEEGFRLFPIQVCAINSFIQFGGLFAPIPVGGGKTLITLKIADWAYHNGIQRSLLIVPSQVYSQLAQADIPMARWNLSISVPFYLLGGKSRERRRRIVSGQREGCYVMPYSFLSTTDTNFLLEMIDPGLLICDEVHRIKSRRAARTRRLMKFVQERKPLMAALSGTITAKSVMDYHHLLVHTLGENSPLPQPVSMAADWAKILDTDQQPAPAQLQILAPLRNWAKKHFPTEPFPFTVSGVRAAYRHRLHTAPGVVASKHSSVGTSLVFHNVPAEKPSEQLQELINQVEKEWKTPNGDEIDFAIHKFKWLYELSAGFYNQLTWPSPAKLATKCNISEAEAEDRLQRALEHHEAKQEYLIALREYLKNPHPDADTPMLVGLEISKNGGRKVGRELAVLWRKMKALEFEGMPERDPAQVRVDDYKIRAMIKWAKEIKGGALIWIYHQEVGKWAVEALREAGVEALYAPAGAHGNRVILNSKNASRIIVASIMAHGEGKNLQAFQDQYFLQWPRSAKMAEQVLGRTHRQGQQADTLIVEMNRTLHFDHLMFAACLTDALYIHQTTGNRQKLVFGTYDPMPKVYSPEFLREHGLQNQLLSQQQRKFMEQRFGKFEDLT